MVALVAASSFVLLHAAQSLELLRMMLPRTRVGNFGVKKFSFPVGFYEIFNTKIYNAKICNTNISDLRHISFMTHTPPTLEKGSVIKHSEMVASCHLPQCVMV